MVATSAGLPAGALSVTGALVAAGVMAAVTLLTRAFPFLFFRRPPLPPIVRFIASYIPPMMMTILVLYGLKDIRFGDAPYGIPELFSLAVIALLHLWRRSALFSIFGGTLLYMALVQTHAVTRLLSAL